MLKIGLPQPPPLSPSMHPMPKDSETPAERNYSDGSFKINRRLPRSRSYDRRAAASGQWGKLPLIVKDIHSETRGRQRQRGTFAGKHRPPSFWRRNFNFGAITKPHVPMNKVHCGPLNLSGNKKGKWPLCGIFCLHRCRRLCSCSEIKVASPEAWRPMPANYHLQSSAHAAGAMGNGGGERESKEEARWDGAARRGGHPLAE